MDILDVGNKVASKQSKQAKQQERCSTHWIVCTEVMMIMMMVMKAGRQSMIYQSRDYLMMYGQEGIR